MAKSANAGRLRRASGRLGRIWYFTVLVGFWLSFLLALCTTDSPRPLWVVFWILTLACIGLIIGAWVREAPYESAAREAPFTGSILSGDQLAAITTVVSMAPSTSRMRGGETGLHTLMTELPHLDQVWLIGCQEDAGQEQAQEAALKDWLLDNLPGRGIRPRVMPSPKISRHEFNHQHVLDVSGQLNVWRSGQQAGLVVDITADTKITSVELWLAAFYSGLPVICQITQKSRVADDDLVTEGTGRSGKREKRAAFRVASATFRALPLTRWPIGGDGSLSESASQAPQEADRPPV